MAIERMLKLRTVLVQASNVQWQVHGLSFERAESRCTFVSPTMSQMAYRST